MTHPLTQQGQSDRQNGQGPRTDLGSNSQAQDRYMEGYGTKKS
jgi:hypothetical protein